MAKATLTPRAKTVLVFVLILLPLVTTALIKYGKVFSDRQEISSVAILHPRLIGSKEFTHLENDVANRLREVLADVPGLVVSDVPAMTSVGKTTLAELAMRVDASALIVPTLTIDAGIVQLNLQVIETRTAKVIFNTPYQSSIDNYPGMMKAAGAVLKRALF